LTIYIPAYQRPEVADLLQSLAPQLTAECEVIVSDDDPQATAADLVRSIMATAPCRVEYRHNVPRLGGPDNLHLGLTVGTGEWLWMLSDDDVVLPDAVANILQVTATHDFDRVILLSPQADSPAAGLAGSANDIAQRDPGLLIAATLITANVLRREALNLRAAENKKTTLYGPAWAYTGCQRIKVMAAPAFTVGAEHAGEFVAATDPTVNIGQVWTELLANGYGVQPSQESFAWNFVSVSQAA
jgi:glycosyltransferase involved in cell wall biosynthesis